MHRGNVTHTRTDCHGVFWKTVAEDSLSPTRDVTSLDGQHAEHLSSLFCSLCFKYVFPCILPPRAPLSQCSKKRECQLRKQRDFDGCAHLSFPAPRTAPATVSGRPTRWTKNNGLETGTRACTRTCTHTRAHTHAQERRRPGVLCNSPTVKKGFACPPPRSLSTPPLHTYCAPETPDTAAALEDS